MAKKLKNEKLNARQELFCREYIIDHNQGDAYELAGYKFKNRNVRDVCASQLLRNPKIQKRIEQLEKKHIARLEKQKDDITKELENHAFSDIGDYIETVNVVPDLDKLFAKIRKSNLLSQKEGLKLDLLERAGSRILRIKNLGELTAEQRRSIKSMHETKDGIRIELMDKYKPLERLDEHLNPITKNIKLKGSLSTEEDITKLTDEEIKARIEALEKVVPA